MLAENDLACDEEGMATVKLRDSEELLRPFLESSSKLVRGQQKQDGTKRSILSTAEDPSASPGVCILMGEVYSSNRFIAIAKSDRDENHYKM